MLFLMDKKHKLNKCRQYIYQWSELDYLIYNDPLAYADHILNGDPETYLKTVTEFEVLNLTIATVAAPKTE